MRPCFESCVRKLLSAGARDHGVCDTRECSPLMVASCRGLAGVARLLLDAGAPMDERSPDYGSTALFDAICHGANDVFALLLNAGADVTAVDIDGRTPIFICAFANNHASLLLLLERGASPDVIDNFGSTPLTFSCQDEWEGGDIRLTVEELVRVSSTQTLCAVRNSDGRSAIDVLVRRRVRTDGENFDRHAWRP